jgi:hypothetical protein
MESLAELTFFGTRAFYRPKGEVSTGELADMLTTTLAQARDAEVTDVLLNITALSGFESPGSAYRRWVARRWAKALGPDIRLALVARHEHICPEKTGLLIAAEEGVHAHICESEAEALIWLDASKERHA